MCFSFVSLTSSTVNFYNDNLGIIHIAYDDDVPLLSRTKHSLITNFDRLSVAISTVGLSINASKCEFLYFRSPPPASTFWLGSSTIPCLASIKWLGLSFSTPLSSTCSAVTSRVLKSMRVGYGKISPNRGRYNRKGLCCLYASFCAPAVFYVSGIAFLLCKKDTKKIRSGYFKYCKFLLRLPRL